MTKKSKATKNAVAPGLLQRVSIKSLDDTTAIIQGWGVIFGGEDLDGETFEKDTDFALSLVPEKPIYYDHRYEAVKNDLGITKSVTLKDDGLIGGLWVEAQLDRSKAYVEEVLKLVEAGALGWSSGSAGHLIDRLGKSIKRWPIIEFSLTPTPAEPRTLGVEQIKSLVKAHPELEVFLPNGSAPKGEKSPSAKTAAGKPQTKATNHEVNTMYKLLAAYAEKHGKSVEELSDAEVAEALKGSKFEQKPEADLDAVRTKAVEDFKAAEKATADAEAALQAKIDEGVTKALDNLPALKEPGFIAKNIGILKQGYGGDEHTKAFLSYLRTGQENKHFKNSTPAEIKASNDTDMNVGTAADGGNAVPTGHYQGVIARRDEQMLAKKLGVRNIPGKGTTVNVPLDNEADGEFVLTSEAASFNRDAPALDTVAMTLGKYTKSIEISYELLEDEDSRLMAFLDDFVGRGLAKTHNNLLLTAVASSGTSLKTFASKSTFTAGDFEAGFVGNNDLGDYLEDDASVAWVMRRSSFWTIKALRSASGRTYAVGGDELLSPMLLGYPTYFSQKAAAPASAAKSVYFGNWNFVGFREAPGLTVLRDPYSKARSGQLVLHYYFRTVYNVLQAEAIGYGIHPVS